MPALSRADSLTSWVLCGEPAAPRWIASDVEASAHVITGPELCKRAGSHVPAHSVKFPHTDPHSATNSRSATRVAAGKRDSRRRAPEEKSASGIALDARLARLTGSVVGGGLRLAGIGAAIGVAGSLLGASIVRNAPVWCDAVRCSPLTRRCWHCSARSRPLRPTCRPALRRASSRSSRSGRSRCRALAPVLFPGDEVLLEEVRINFKAQSRSRRDFEIAVANLRRI